jgi:hypothetical protein
MVARGEEEEEDAVRRARGEEGGEGAECFRRARVAVGHERRVAFIARAIPHMGDLPLQIAQEPVRSKLSSARAFFARLLEVDRAHARCKKAVILALR